MYRQRAIRRFAVSTALTLSFGAAAPLLAQTTPGDQSGTATAAGAGQSAPTTTNAPATDQTNPPAATTAPPITTAPATTTAPPAKAARGGGGASVGGAGDIIVTARRVEERLQDVPISITVYNQQQLTNRNIVNAQDLAAYTPSLSANNNFGSQNTAFAIRGFVQEIGTQPSVGVYFADVVAPRGASTNLPIGDGAGPGSFFDLQNVQVLKGPQGTLFGRNTTGGAVLLVPQKPTDKLDGYVEGSYGNYGMKRIQGVFNTPIGDNARFRIGVDHEQRDGYIHNDSGVGPSRYNDIDYTAVRASLVVDLTPDIENYTIATYSRSTTTGDLEKVIAANNDPSLLNFFGQAASAQLAKYGNGFYTGQSDMIDPGTKLTQWQVINTTTWKATDSLTVKNIMSYAQLKEDFTNPVFGTAFDLYDTQAGSSPAYAGLRQLLGINVQPGTRVDVANSTPIPGGDTANQSTFTDEFQLQGKSLADKLVWQTGAYAELSDPLGTTGSQSPSLLYCENVRTFNCQSSPLTAFGLGSVTANPGRTNFRNYGLYAQGTYALTDKLKFTGGVRYTWDRVRNTTDLLLYKVPTPGDGVFSGCQQGPSYTYPCTTKLHTGAEKPTWVADVDYKPTDNILLYAKYSRGFRAGGITAQAPASLAIFKPEKVDAYEGGIKTEFRGFVRGTFNVAGFYNKFRNQQLQVNLDARTIGVGAVGATGIVNADKSRSWGFEAESAIQLVHGLEWDTSYTYLNTKILKITDPADDPASVYTLDYATLNAIPGRQALLSPKNKVSTTLSYTLPIDPAKGKVAVGATFTHTDKQIANYASSYGVLAKRNLLNLNLNWNNAFGSPVDLSAFVTNLTNKKYLTFVAGLYNAAGFEAAQIGEPRMFGGRIKYHFGG